MDKSESQRRHAAYRARTRLQVVLTKELRTKILLDIKERRLVRVTKASHRISIYVATVNDRETYVVVDHKRNNIVTFLDPETYCEKEHMNFFERRF